MYCSLNKTNVKYDNLKAFSKTIFGKIFMIVGLVIFLLVLFLKVDYRINPTMYYGSGVGIVYILVLFSSLYILVSLIINNKKMQSYKSWAILVTVFIYLGVFFYEF